MGKTQSKRAGPDPAARFIRLDEDLLQSMAWKCLSPAAMFLFIELKRRWPGMEFGVRTLPYSYVSWKLTHYKFKQARKELIDLGFLIMEKPGGLMRQRCQYRLSEGWKKASKDLADSRRWRMIEGITPGGGAGSVPVKEKIDPGRRIENLKQFQKTKPNRKAKSGHRKKNAGPPIEIQLNP